MPYRSNLDSIPIQSRPRNEETANDVVNSLMKTLSKISFQSLRQRLRRRLGQFGRREILDRDLWAAHRRFSPRRVASGRRASSALRRPQHLLQTGSWKSRTGHQGNFPRPSIRENRTGSHNKTWLHITHFGNTEMYPLFGYHSRTDQSELHH